VAQLLKLIQNEWMKLWAKKSSWIIIVLLALIVIFPAIIESQISDYDDGLTWQQREQENIKMNEQFYEDREDPFYQEQILISQYRLDNNVPPDYSYTTMAYVDYGVSLMIIITLFTVIIAAGIVSSEFSTGTIKMLLTRPVARARVLTSKLLTVFIFGLLLYGFTLVLSYLTGVVMFDNAQYINLVVENGQVVEGTLSNDIFKTAVYSFGDFVMSILFAFMIGSVFRSSSLAIGLTMGISFLGSMLVLFLSRYEIVKYIWITHSDLTQHLTGNFIVDGITLPFSLTVLAIYAAIFLFVSYFVFMKRDITA
jgi:ABC-2 type transport system permease protein